MITRSRKTQQGVSLIELMIAITLGLFIVGAMVTLFISSQESYRMNENLARLQENARFAVLFISRDLRMAGYNGCAAADPVPDAVDGEDDPASPEALIGDTVTVIWHPNDCDEALSTRTITYSVEDKDTGMPALFRNVDGTRQELVEGISDLQLWYGEDTDNDNIPNYFVDIDSVTNLQRVVGIRLTLSARTPGTNLASDGGVIERDFTTTLALRNRLP